MDSFCGEIRIFAFNWPPMDWAYCNGQTVPLQQYAALAAVIGKTYGGDGSTTIGLPNLQGAAPLCAGSGPGLTPRPVASVSGSSAVVLTQVSMPAHSHTVSAHEVAQPFTGLQASPGGAYVARLVQPVGTGFYTASAFSDTTSANTAMSPTVLAPTTGGAAHANMQPYLVMNFCISLLGEFPVRP